MITLGNSSKHWKAATRILCSATLQGEGVEARGILLVWVSVDLW